MVKGHESSRELKPNLASSAAQSLSGARISQSRSKRKNTSTACENCRLKRIKCTGGSSPCDNCSKLNIPCHIDTRSDQRRKAVTKVKLQELEQDQRVLDTLLKALQGLNDIRVDQTLASIVPSALNRTDRDAVQKLSTSNPVDQRLNTVVQQNIHIAAHLPQLQAHRKNLDPSLKAQSQSSSYSTEIEDSSHDHGVDKEDTETISEYLTSPVLSGYDSFQTISADLNSDSSTKHVAPGAVRSFGNLALSAAIRANQYPAHIQARQLDVINGPIQTCMPLQVHRQLETLTSTVINTVLSFQEIARSQIMQGACVRDVLSMDAFNLDLFFRGRNANDEHDLANWACEWGKAWSGFPTEVRLAAAHYICSYVRWLIMPCKETYEMMPPPVRPLMSQLLVPHTFDIDLWGAPPMVREMQLFSGHSFLDSVHTGTQRLLWPHGPEACFENIEIACSAASPDAIANERGGYSRLAPCLTSEFVAFINTAENWSVHRDMLLQLPGLLGLVNIHDD